MLKRIAIVLSFAFVVAVAPASAQRFIFTGVTDADVLAFFDKLQKAVGAGNKAAVASMVNYPLRVNNANGRRLVVASSAELLKQYDAVFTPAIRQAIAAERPAKLVGGHDGAAIAAGLVWLTGKCDKAKPPKCVLGIISVNHQ